jgi:hypothetical protein
MVTVHRQSGLRFVIYVDDHEPAHLHVYGDGEAKINLAGGNGLPELLWADEMKRGDIRRAMQIVTQSQEYFLIKWSEIHG